MKVVLETMTRNVKNDKRLFAGLCICINQCMQFLEETSEVVIAEVVIAFYVVIVNTDLL